MPWRKVSKAITLGWSMRSRTTARGLNPELVPVTMGSAGGLLSGEWIHAIFSQVRYCENGTNQLVAFHLGKITYAWHMSPTRWYRFSWNTLAYRRSFIGQGILWLDEVESVMSPSCLSNLSNQRMYCIHSENTNHSLNGACAGQLTSCVHDASCLVLSKGTRTKWRSLK